MFGKYVGAPSADTSKDFIPAELWPVVSEEILKQCDALDGRVDGMISEPDDCEFDPQPLLCVDDHTNGCLTAVQVEALRKIYSPIRGSNGEVLCPRYDPGAEADEQWEYLLSGEIVSFADVSAF